MNGDGEAKLSLVGFQKLGRFGDEQKTGAILISDATGLPVLQVKICNAI
jgi:hypothetical protein